MAQKTRLSALRDTFCGVSSHVSKYVQQNYTKLQACHMMLWCWWHNNGSVKSKKWEY